VDDAKHLLGLVLLSAERKGLGGFDQAAEPARVCGW
jgi:hypothetical protein